MKNYYENQGNKTSIFFNGTPILIDTNELKRVESIVHLVTIDKKGFPIATLKYNKRIPFSVFITKAKKNEHVYFKNGRTDCRRKSLEVTVR